MAKVTAKETGAAAKRARRRERRKAGGSNVEAVNDKGDPPVGQSPKRSQSTEDSRRDLNTSDGEFNLRIRVGARIPRWLTVRI